ncbi:MAG: alkaline phosphatase family protein [Acholeplasmatales bacterium]
MVDYENNLINVTNSLLKHYNAKTHHPTLPILDDVLSHNYKHVIVMLLDGMGVNILENLNKDSFLRKNVKMTISSVFPPTTVAATNAFLRGETPYELGFLGWCQYNKFADKTDTIFLKKDYYTDEKINNDLNNLLLRPNFLEQIKEVNKDLHVEAIFPAPINGSDFETFSEQLDRLLMITKGGRSLSYCYFDHPDTTIHRDGINGPNTKEKLEYLNQTIVNFKEKLNHDVLVIIVADHGLIDIKYLYIKDHKEMAETFYRLPSIEDRAKTFFVKPECKDKFVSLFNKHFQPGFILYTKEELLKSNLFGYGEKHPILDSFIGEYTAISISNKTIAYERDENPFKSHHAGLTKEELSVPLIILT